MGDTSPSSETLAAVVRCVYQFAHDPSGWLDQSEQWLALAEDFDLQDLPADQLSPHLQAVEQLAESMTPVVPEPRSPLGVVYLNHDGKLLHANDQAQIVLAPLNVALRSGQGLSWPGPEGPEALAGYLQDAQRGSAPVVVQFRALGKIVLGLLSRRVQEFVRDSARPPPAEAAYALLLPGASMVDESVSWLRAKGLTATESQVAMGIGSGRSPQEVASDMGTSINTVRTHVRAIFEKLGVNRQGELVKAISDLAAISQWLREPAIEKPAPSADAPAAPLAPRRYLQLASGRRIAYRDYGPATSGLPEGGVVIYCHSGWGHTLLLPEQEQTLQRLQLRWLAIERPGFGETDAVAPYSMAAVIEDLEALIDHLQLSDYLLLGAASGVRAALHGAVSGALRGKPPAAVIGVAPRVGKADQASPETANLFVRQYLRMARNPALIESLCRLIAVPSRRFVWRRMLSLAFGDALNQLEPVARATLSRFVMHGIADATAHTSQGISDELSYLVQQPRCALDSLAVPVQLWHGDHDDVVGVANLRAYADTAPDAALVAMPGPNGLLEFSHFEALARAASALLAATEPANGRLKIQS